MPRLLPCLLVCLAAAPLAAQTLITEPAQGFTSVYNFIASATRTLDMTMYELVDTTAEQSLATLAARGVNVRVILDQNDEKTFNQPAYTFLNSHGCHAVWANPAYPATHQKTITVDGATSMILTANLTTRYYSTSRDFALTDTTAADVAEIEAVFNADFASAAVNPTPAAALIWSPNEASAALTSLIASATHTLLVENEEMSDATIVSALAARARAGIAVTLIMTNTSNTYATEFTSLTAAGVKVYTYAPTAALYIHAKVIVVDSANSTRKAFVGSENFSVPSLTANRELGQTTTNPTIIATLASTLTSDAKSGTLWPNVAKSARRLKPRKPS